MPPTTQDHRPVLEHAVDDLKKLHAICVRDARQLVFERSRETDIVADHQLLLERFDLLEDSSQVEVLTGQPRSDSLHLSRRIAVARREADVMFCTAGLRGQQLSVEYRAATKLQVLPAAIVIQAPEQCWIEQCRSYF